MEHCVDGSTASSTTAPSHRTLGEALDEAPLSLFHLKAAFTAAMGFFTDAYDLFIIGVALVLIKGEWHLSAVQTSFLGSATLLATLVGALVFGRVADLLGRTRVYGLVAGIMAWAPSPPRWRRGTSGWSPADSCSASGSAATTR
jgi:MFS family permease